MSFFEKYWIYGLGFLGQGLFGARLVVQLIISERQKKVASPTAFWLLSLGASFLFLIYGILRDDVVIIFGQTISYFIYIRNLQLKNDWQKFPLSLQFVLFALPVFAILWILISPASDLKKLWDNNDLTDPIIILGAIGQLLLNFRFLYQWYSSEKEKDSVLPLGFWAISTFASVLVLIYAYYRVDPVLLVAQGLGIFVYIRNMIIYFKQQQIRE